MSFFSSIKKWVIPKSAIFDSLRQMASDGAAGNEGIVLWLGSRSNKCTITHLVALRGQGIIKRPRQLMIGSNLLNRVADLTLELNITLVGQIHSHGGTWVELSPTDRAYGVAVPGYLSIVAPYYGMKLDTTIYDCGVYAFESHLGYRRLSPSEVALRIQIVENHKLPLIILGEE